METFIYYVVGLSIMKQLLDENEWTINIFHDSTKEICKETAKEEEKNIIPGWIGALNHDVI